MGYPAESVDGKRLDIVDSRIVEGIKILLDAEGNQWKASVRPLRLELVKAAEVLTEDVETVVAESKEAVEEIGSELAEAVEEVGQAVEDAIEEVGDAVEDLIEDATEAASEIIEAVEDLIPGGDEPSDSEAAPESVEPTEDDVSSPK